MQAWDEQEEAHRAYAKRVAWLLILLLGGIGALTVWIGSPGPLIDLLWVALVIGAGLGLYAGTVWLLGRGIAGCLSALARLTRQLTRP